MIVRDDRGQVASWLVKLLLGLAIVGFVLIEFGAVAINRLQAGDIAGQAASEAGIVYSNTNNLGAARNRAETYVALNDAELVDIELVADDRLAVTLQKTAATRVIHRIDALSGLVTVQVTESAPLR